MHIGQFSSPVGHLILHEDNNALVRVSWARDGNDFKDEETPLLTEAKRQLAAYFDGGLVRFELPMRVDGSAFQQEVCDAIFAIPYGETATYGEIAKTTGKSAQAVGNACGGNPIPVIIPCHRVLGASGLGGFSGAGGVDTKVALLRLEGAAGLLI